MLDVAPSGRRRHRRLAPLGAGLDAARAPSVNVNSGKDSPLFNEVSVSDEGDAIVVWSGDSK